MTKKVINQNDKFREELINTIEPNFVFNDKPINRFINNNTKPDDNRPIIIRFCIIVNKSVYWFIIKNKVWFNCIYQFFPKFVILIYYFFSHTMFKC